MMASDLAETTTAEATPDSAATITDDAAHNGKPDFGYDFFPGRTGGKYKPSWWEHLLLRMGKDFKEQIACERCVAGSFKESEGVKLMMGALKASGCPFDIGRNVSCETCEEGVTGGFDPVNNQIVVCQNRAFQQSVVQAILVHEMIHMFDFCTTNMEFANLDHLACTEIRAANLTHCSFVSSMLMKDSSPINIKGTHKDCVQDKAACSLVAARGITKREAMEVVGRVFPRCYADLEPIGRQVRRNSSDLHRAYLERRKYGYI